MRPPKLSRRFATGWWRWHGGSLFLLFFLSLCSSSWWGVGRVGGDGGGQPPPSQHHHSDLFPAGSTAAPPEFEVKLFVIFTTARSGSGWTIRMLDSHPRISCQNLEPFGQVYDEFGEKADHIPWEAPAQGEPGFRQFIDRVFANRCSTHSTALKGTELACGFKVLYSQVPLNHTTRIFQYLASRGVAIIHLVRANVLRTDLSWQFYLRDTGAGLSSHTSNASYGIRSPFHVDPPAVVRRLKKRIAEVQKFRALIQRYRPADHYEMEYSAITTPLEDADPVHPYTSGGNPQCNALMAFLHPGLVGFNCQADARQAHNVVQQHGYQRCTRMVDNWDVLARAVRGGLSKLWGDLLLDDCDDGV